MAGGARVALVHDWLTGMRGGERVLEEIAALFPEADLFTLFHVAGSTSPALEALPKRTSFLQRLPFLRRAYRYYLPLFPRAAESLDLSGYDLVVSSSHCVAKGVRPAEGAVHICYCHTPMRYAWDRFDDYFGKGRGGPVPRPLARPILARLREWDRRTAARVDRFVANSRHVAGRIRDCYGRDAEVIPPPVDVERFQPGPAADRDGAYLIVSALVPYKRVDVAIAAFRGGRRRLRIAGDGPSARAWRRLAGPEVTFLGRVSDADLRREYQRCRALIVPGVEDAGIAPLEAMACGTPVIARNEGGVPEVVTASTGILYEGADAPALRAALDRFESEAARFETATIRRHAEQFDRWAFRGRLAAVLPGRAARREAS